MNWIQFAFGLALGALQGLIAGGKLKLTATEIQILTETQTAIGIVLTANQPPAGV